MSLIFFLCIIQAKLRLHNNEDIKSYKAFFGLNGGYADYFSITRLGGEISVVSNLPYSSYYLYVSAFLDITFKNGTKFHNYTQASFRIILHGEIYNYVLHTLGVGLITGTINCDLGRNRNT